MDKTRGRGQRKRERVCPICTYHTKKCLKEELLAAEVSSEAGSWSWLVVAIACCFSTVADTAWRSPIEGFDSAQASEPRDPPAEAVGRPSCVLIVGTGGLRRREKGRSFS